MTTFRMYEEPVNGAIDRINSREIKDGVPCELPAAIRLMPLVPSPAVLRVRVVKSGMSLPTLHPPHTVVVTGKGQRFKQNR